jgi:hypothetical protein
MHVKVSFGLVHKLQNHQPLWAMPANEHSLGGRLLMCS